MSQVANTQKSGVRSSITSKRNKNAQNFVTPITRPSTSQAVSHTANPYYRKSTLFARKLDALVEKHQQNPQFNHSIASSTTKNIAKSAEQEQTIATGLQSEIQDNNEVVMRTYDDLQGSPSMITRPTREQIMPARASTPNQVSKDKSLSTKKSQLQVRAVSSLGGTRVGISQPYESCGQASSIIDHLHNYYSNQQMMANSCVFKTVDRTVKPNFLCQVDEGNYNCLSLNGAPNATEPKVYKRPNSCIFQSSAHRDAVRQQFITPEKPPKTQDEQNEKLLQSQKAYLAASYDRRYEMIAQKQMQVEAKQQRVQTAKNVRLTFLLQKKHPRGIDGYLIQNDGDKYAQEYSLKRSNIKCKVDRSVNNAPVRTDAQVRQGGASTQLEFYQGSAMKTRDKDRIVPMTHGWNQKIQPSKIPQTCYNLNPIIQQEQDTVKNLLNNYKMDQSHLELMGRYMNPYHSDMMHQQSKPFQKNTNPNKRFCKEQRDISLLAPYQLDATKATAVARMAQTH